MNGGAPAIGQSREALSRLLSADIPPSASGVLAVDLAALVRNYRKLRGIAAPAECAAVVKGVGYGLGVEPVAKALHAGGCRTFFVATPDEAEALRGVLAQADIYVLDGLFPGGAGDFARLDLRPVLGSMAEIGEWQAFCQAIARPLPGAIHVDTGMNRLGLKGDDRRALLAAPEMLNGFSLALIMSHLACADTPDHPKNAAQLEDFMRFAAQLPPAPLSLANSAGIFLGAGFCLDLVRPGIALYGGNPFAGRPNPMEPVIRLYGRVAQIGEAEAGETIGYGASLRVPRRTRYAAIAVGYADGYFRALGSSDARQGAVAHIDGERLPILGRVSMDLIVFDVTGIAPERVGRGGFVELIGDRFTVDDAAALAGTIGYEFLTNLGPRYHRIYTGAVSGHDDEANPPEETHHGQSGT